MFGSILKLNFRLLKVIEYCIFRSMILNVVNNLFCYFQNSRVPGLLVPGHVSHQEEDVVLRLVRLAQENVQGNHNYRSGQLLFWNFFIVNNFILGNAVFQLFSTLGTLEGVLKMSKKNLIIILEGTRLPNG